MRLDAEQCGRLAAAARVATLATLGGRGADLVPFVFAVVADSAGDRIVSAVDHKPKSTAALARLRNVEADPRVTVLVQHYDEDDWDVLWWVRIRGSARVVSDEPERTASIAPLVAKYPQYRNRPPAGPALVITVEEWTGWAATIPPPA